jgi:hypothetical protein
MNQARRDDALANPSRAGQASSWLVPPLIVPALLAILIVASAIYQAYF